MYQFDYLDRLRVGLSFYFQTPNSCLKGTDRANCNISIVDYLLRNINISNRLYLAVLKHNLAFFLHLIRFLGLTLSHATAFAMLALLSQPSL